MKLAGYTQIHASTGRPLYVRNTLHPLFMKVYKEYRTDYHMTSIMRTLMSLNADALRGKKLNAAGDDRSIIFGHIAMRYNIFNGAVLINVLAVRNPNASDKTGLYKVKYTKRRDEWLTQKDKAFSLDKSQQWKSESEQAHYAAVAGQFRGGISDAARQMPQHIIGAYEKAHYLTRHDRGDQYSLFWVEKGAHKSAEAAESLASIMQQSAKNQLPVNWLIHGDGVHTFKNAAKLIQASPLANAAGRAKSGSAGKATNQRAYFSNPASSDSESSLKALCEQAGLTFVDINTSNRDLRRWSTLKNVGRELGKPVAIGLATGSIATSDIGLETIGASGFDKVVTHSLDSLSSGNYIGAALGALGAGWLVVTAVGKRKSVGASIKCTFGKGNERWYSGDQQLLS